MASSSSSISCFQCGESSSNFDHFKNGWRLRSGQFAQLCPHCAYAYEEGRFCETFHSSDDGWRDCESCGKLVHCGCIVSFNAYMLLDFGGVICMECSRINFVLARDQCLALEKQLLTGESQNDHARRSLIEPQCWPRVGSLDLQLITKHSETCRIPLFEKRLSASDVDLKYSRITIPNKCAEVFFPHISDPNGIPFKILDTEGNEWEFNCRYWIHNGSKVYILEGLRSIIITKKWQAGDTVVFYKVDPGGKLAIGLRKASSSRLQERREL